MKDIRAVIFDFGGVICNFDLRLFLSGIAPYSPHTVDELAAGVHLSMDAARKYETGLISSDEFYHAVSLNADLKIKREEFRKAYTNIFSPIDTTFSLIRQLHGEYTLGLLSNTSEWHFQYGIRTVQVFPLFTTVTLSFEVKSLKPDRPIYDDALAKLGLPAEACAYIDDVQENVDAGRALGLHAIRYTTHEALLAELQECGGRV